MLPLEVKLNRSDGRDAGLLRVGTSPTAAAGDLIALINGLVVSAVLNPAQLDASARTHVITTVLRGLSR
jgi:hypothetical protein